MTWPLRAWPRWLGVVVLVLAGLQLVQPGPPEPRLSGDGPMSSHLVVPGSVEDVLRRACYDCHSAETRWPWYSRLSPLSWYIAYDVEAGRSDLDFSHWSTDPEIEPTPSQRLRWMCEEARDEFMPPVLYRLAHPEARLTPADKDLICSWSADALLSLAPAEVMDAR